MKHTHNTVWMVSIGIWLAMFAFEFDTVRNWIFLYSQFSFSNIQKWMRQTAKSNIEHWKLKLVMNMIWESLHQHAFAAL